MDVEKYWNIFVGGFCKVEFLCFSGDPNWLGWIAIVWGSTMVLGFIILMLTAVFN
jgi:hypothetical protein